MAEARSADQERSISRDQLAQLLNEDLAREYQAIISYVIYSQVLSGAEYMSIADQLEIHAKQELEHALIISRQIDYLGEMPIATPKPVQTPKEAKEMLRADLRNEVETIRNYRERVRQCEELGEYAMAEQIRQILVNEQDHQIDLATALGEEVPAIEAPQGTKSRKGSRKRKGICPPAGQGEERFLARRGWEPGAQSARAAVGSEMDNELVRAHRRVRREISGGTPRRDRSADGAQAAIPRKRARPREEALARPRAFQASSRLHRARRGSRAGAYTIQPDTE